MAEIKRNFIYNKDARSLNKIINNKIVDVTITSPPYFDLKDYGYKEQIGFGQEYEQYLADLKLVFKNVFDCTKDNGTLWVVIDSFRRDNEVTPLPFDFSNTIKDLGWKLQEVIIWVKDKTVPWAHQGQMRNLFEYILLFSKGKEYNFYIDEVRDFETLKKWWVKYPERYNPKGKIPDGLWNFDIPIQGSWGEGYIKHFCPLPEELIAQILLISSKEGNLVLDPFAGSGAVLAKAANMQRDYIGFELNNSYIEMFKTYQKKYGQKKQEKYLKHKQNKFTHEQFSSLILQLRELKYAKILLKKMPSIISKDIERIYVKRSTAKPSQQNAHFVTSFIFLIKPTADKDVFILRLAILSLEAPLSKFGIQPSFEIEDSLEVFMKRITNRNELYTYTKVVTYKFHNKIKFNQIKLLPKNEIIVSNIKVELNEKDYE